MFIMLSSVTENNTGKNVEGEIKENNTVFKSKNLFISLYE